MAVSWGTPALEFEEVPPSSEASASESWKSTTEVPGLDETYKVQTAKESNSITPQENIISPHEFVETEALQPYKGCYKDNTHGKRDLPVKKGSGKTQGACESACVGFKYFGRQWDRECFCGNSYGSQGKSSGCKCHESNIGGNKNCVYRNRMEIRAKFRARKAKEKKGKDRERKAKATKREARQKRTLLEVRAKEKKGKAREKKAKAKEKTAKAEEKKAKEKAKKKRKLLAMKAKERKGKAREKKAKAKEKKAKRIRKVLETRSKTEKKWRKSSAKIAKKSV